MERRRKRMWELFIVDERDSKEIFLKKKKKREKTIELHFQCRWMWNRNIKYKQSIVDWLLFREYWLCRLMVNSKKKDILERYRTLLESNLVLTDELIQWLKEKKAVPDFVFEDVKVGEKKRKTFFFVLLILKQKKRIIFQIGFTYTNRKK